MKLYTDDQIKFILILIDQIETVLSMPDMHIREDFKSAASDPEPDERKDDIFPF